MVLKNSAFVSENKHGTCSYYMSGISSHHTAWNNLSTLTCVYLCSSRRQAHTFPMQHPMFGNQPRASHTHLAVFPRTLTDGYLGAAQSHGCFRVTSPTQAAWCQHWNCHAESFIPSHSLHGESKGTFMADLHVSVSGLQRQRVLGRAPG